jgi:zinc transport system substrate-binding protein
MCSCRRSLPWLLGIVFVTLGLGFAGCTRAPDPWKAARTGQKHVLVTFPALFCLTHAVAGDDAYVLCFLSDKDPHNYSFTPADGVKAKDTDLLISNGLGLDDTFVEQLALRIKATLNVGEALQKKGLVHEMADDDDDDKKSDKHDDKKHDHAKHDDKGHHHEGGFDPHVWLGPPQAMAMADVIAAKLEEVDPPHAEGYKKRAAQLKEELKKLQEDGKARFKEKKNRTVVTMHDSMGYFAKAFGIEIADSIQLQPGQTASEKRLADLVTLCKEKHVNVITYESAYNKAQPELLQRELKSRGQEVHLAEFDPLERSPLAKDSVNPDAGFYMTKMRTNIDNLVKALP